MPLAQDSRPDCIRLLKVISDKKYKEEKGNSDDEEDDAKKDEKPSAKKKATGKPKKGKPPVDTKMLLGPKKVTAQTEPHPQTKKLISRLFDFKFAFGYLLPILPVLL